MTKEYKTVSSMVLMFKWRTSNESFSNTVIIFTIWPGICFEITLSNTFDPEIFASTSATEELQHAPSSLKCSAPNELILISGGCWGDNWGNSTGLGLGLGLGLKLFLCFLYSKAWRTWCNSLIKSITPPIIEAWSP